MIFGNRAEMGIGTLIIFIAMLLVAAVAAGVLIQTNAALQEKALTTGDQAKGQISTNVRVIEVSATDGSDGDIEYYNQIMKLSPGSEPIKLSQALLTMNTYDASTTLQYRGTTGVHELNYTDGYYTYRDVVVTGTANTSQNISLTGIDLNHDGMDDRIEIVSAADAVVYVFNSSAIMAGNQRSIGSCAATGPLTGGLGASLGYIDSIEQSGNLCTAEDAFTADSSTATLTIIPVNHSTGFFTVEYLQQGSNPVNGNLQRGDVIKLHFQTPRTINEDEHIRLNFIPKIGTPTLTEFITPEVMSDNRIYLYP